MPLGRDIRRLQNAKEGSLASGDTKSVLSYPPAVRNMRDGEQVFAQEGNKQLSLYKKHKGMLWKARFSRDGNQYVDKDLEVKGKTTLRNNLTVSGNVGIGEVAPEGNLHISSLTDATIILEADTDDATESDNPRIELRQDGDAIRGYLGIEGAAGALYTDSLVNATYLEAKANNTIYTNIQFVTGGDKDAPSNGTARMTITDTGEIGIGTKTPSANADLTLENGVLNLKETTTPTADTNYGKIYTKSDNKLYFQDGAGNEYTVDITAV